MDKLDDFLKNRLNDRSLTESPAEDGWNVPSDDLWHSAKEYFPKEEKKNKWFYWLPILLLLCGCLSIGYYFGKMNSENKTKNKNEIVESSNADLQEKSIKNTSKNKDPKTTNSDKNSEIAPNENTPINTQNGNIDKNLKANISTKKETETVKIITSTKDKLLDETGNIILNDKSNTLRKTTLKPNISPSNADKSNKNTDLQNNAIPNVNIGQDYQQDYPLAKNEKNKGGFNGKDGHSNLSGFVSINSKVPTSLMQSAILTNPIKKPSIPSDIPKRKIHPNKEFGIGYTGILLQPLSKINFNDDDNNDSIRLDLKYSNVNFHYTKWFAKRWSFSSGLYLSKFNLKIDASINDTIGTDDLDYFVSNELNKAIDIKVADTQNDFQIQLLEGAQVAESDLLKIDVEARLLIHSAQIPLLLNYHISKKRMEYIFSLGGSFDIYSINVKEAKIDIYNNDALINEPIGPASPNSPFSINRKFILGSIYTQIAFKYKFNNRLNLGLTAKLNLINPLISGLETGLYYRFY